MPQPKQQPEWFANWFNSAYYHKLYKHRNHAEAHLFINNLLAYLNTPKSTQILDLACGRGRHTLYLHSLGYQATGVDLAPDSIAFAKQQTTNGQPHFAVHDIRQTYCNDCFGLVLNLFTSFGYFETHAQHQQALTATVANLQTQGTLVIDFLNAPKVIKNLVPQEQKTIDGTVFSINRHLRPDGYIEKNIQFKDDQNNLMEFTERVRAYTLPDFEKMFATVGLQLLASFGNYRLEPYQTQTADRLVMVARKV